MKKIALLLSLFMSVTSFAAETKSSMFAHSYKNFNRSAQFYLNPGALFMGMGIVGAELKIAPFASITGGFVGVSTKYNALTNLVGRPKSLQDKDYLLMQGSIGFKFYLTGKALDSGFYLWPSLLAGYIKYDLRNSSVSKLGAATIGGKLTFGYNFAFESGFTSTFGVGVFYDKLLFNEVDRSNISNTPIGRSEYLLLPWLEGTMGYSF